MLNFHAVPISITLLVCVAFSGTAQAQTPTFTGVGDLTGGATLSYAFDVSADGSVVVGESEGSSGTEAFRWTSGGGITGLGYLSGGSNFSTAYGVSENGSVVSGSSNGSDGVRRAYRWAGSMTALNRYSCDSCDPVSDAFGISGDGLVAVGSALARGGGTSPIHLDPVRWAGGGTSISNLGNLSGPEEAGDAFGASPNGSIIVGAHLSNDGKDAWYWTGSGLNALPSITGGSIIAATAYAVSDDGTTIVGYSNKDTIELPGGTVVPTDRQAVKWSGTNYTTLTQLGPFPGEVSIDSAARAVSADGSIIVGRAANEAVSDRAFIWDASNGMRDLKTVLTDDYGLDLTGWVLQEARGISDVVGGAYTIVGKGINPSGDPEGWVAFLTDPPCNDGIDNDSDGPIDHPADTGCLAPSDWSEEPDCSDGLDNDGDGNTDYPADTDCTSAADPTEEPDCSDGIDNDGDTSVDYPDDVGCASALSLVENPACSDGVDNDTDLATDWPADTGCIRASDMSETADCSDGLDNDGDTLTDYPADPDCLSAAYAAEQPECFDGIDNDGDGRIDYPDQYPGCTSKADATEARQCSDGVDNDGDTLVDYPADTGCTSALSANEDPKIVTDEGLFVVDRKNQAVFRVDKTTGAQTLISQNAKMLAPQGLAMRGHLILVADPNGLVAVHGSGEQQVASPPLSDNESLQVVIDGPGDPYILEADGISKVDWSLFGIGTKNTWMAMPTPGVFPVLSAWSGDALARESSGDFLTTGISIWGNGTYRVDEGTQVAALLKPGFKNVKWLDLVVEDDGQILGAGFDYDLAAPGVYRIHPGTGDVSVVNNTYGWQMPTGVTVDQDGEIYVADSGICTDGVCVGGEIVHVDLGTGLGTSLSTGGYIGGELDVIAVPEPGGMLLLLSGIAGLGALHRLRESRRR